MLSRLLLVVHCRARCSPFGIQGLPDVQLARGRHGSSFLGTVQPLRFWHIGQGPDASWVQAPVVAALGFSILGSEQPLRFGDLCPSAPSCRSCRSSRGRSHFRAEQRRRRRRRRGRHEDSKAGSLGSSVRSRLALTQPVGLVQGVHVLSSTRSVQGQDVVLRHCQDGSTSLRSASVISFVSTLTLSPRLRGESSSPIGQAPGWEPS